MIPGTVLMSGSSGFLGRRLSSLLERGGTEVIRVSGRSSAAGVERIDALDPSAWAAVLQRWEPRVVYHLAGTFRAGSASEHLRVNALAASALLDAAESLPWMKTVPIVLAGSAAEYGPLEEGDLPVAETVSGAPASPYGIAKLTQTSMGQAFASRGLAVTTARLTNVVGPGMSPQLAFGAFAEQLKRAEPPFCLQVGDLSAVRDFIEVDDAATALTRLAAEAAAAGRVVNVGSGRPVRVGDAVDALLAFLPRPVEVRVDPARVRNRGSQFVADVSLYRRIVGSHPAPTPLQDSLAAIAREVTGGWVGRGVIPPTT